MVRWTLEDLKNCKESEDAIEFKAAEQGNFAYNGGTKNNPSDRRKCILGYIVALCNSGGGSLVLGMSDKYPHVVVGTKQNDGSIGKLQGNIYKDIKISTDVYELYDDPVKRKGRVLVIDVPNRPLGKTFKFEDVTLTRFGEEMKPMPDEMLFRIMQEQEPDFSAEICKGASLDDLDIDAIDIMKHKYAKKQDNVSFLTLSDAQILSDLHLIKNGKITYAALILVGKKNAIEEYIPQSAILLELRHSQSQIPFDNRITYRDAFYKYIDQLWHDIDLRNGKLDIREGAYIFNLPYFNEEVIRESINNAVAHRDYRRESETVIKLFPDALHIINIGGFPLGVSIDNLLTVPSTPRNRLLADVLSKTGVVERSGQGVDKIIKNTLLEGKDEPDYSHSDSFKVELRLSATIKDKAFAMFLESEQRELAEEDKLSVQEIIGLYNIRKGIMPEKNILDALKRRNLIERRGKTRGTYYVLSSCYYEFCGEEGEYSKNAEWNNNQVLSVIMPHFTRYGQAKMKDLASLLEGHLTRRQVRLQVAKLVETHILNKEGKGAGTIYKLSKEYFERSEIMKEALKIGMEELLRRAKVEDSQ